MIRFTCVALFCLGFLKITAVGVAGSAASPGEVIIQWDNDLLAGSDQNYTNGLRVAVLKELENPGSLNNPLERGLYALSGATGDTPFAHWRLHDPKHLRFAWGTGVTQLMFTPDDPEAASAPEGQRPYASWLGLEFSLHATDNKSASSVTLSLGTTGKNSYGADVQTWVHENVSDSPVFHGWDSQVPGELTVNFHFDHKRRIGFPDHLDDWPLEIDGYYEWGGSVGNFRTDVYLGALIRAGRNLQPAFATPRVQLGSSGQPLFLQKASPEKPVSFAAFFGARGSAVLHDITLDGPVFRSFDTGVDSEPIVGELLFGFSLRYKQAEFSISRTFRSDEFAGQKENHHFGSLMFRMQLPF